jgi:hypothetical protein
MNELILKGIGKTNVRKAYDSYIKIAVNESYKMNCDVCISFKGIGISDVLGLEDAEITFGEVHHFLNN